jgi:hypothetical protein
LLSEYAAYCALPSPRTALALAEAIANTHEAPQDSIDVWKWGCRQKHDSVILSTSGTTTGKPRRYRFGPLANYWIPFLERLTKFPDGVKPVLVVNQQISKLTTSSVGFVEYIPAPGEPHIAGYLSISHFDDEMVVRVRNTLNWMRGTVLWGDPNVWLYLTAHHHFQDYIAETGVRILSTCWEPFFKTKAITARGAVVNDTMINWHNGFNFCTCRFGNRHSYPTFVADGDKAINLLNLTGVVGAVDDLVIERGRCQCGKMTVTVIPHIETQPRIGKNLLYDLSLVERLDGVYSNFQIVQSNSLQVHFVGEMSDADRDVIVAHCGEVEFVPDSLLRISTKLPAFYLNRHSLPFSNVRSVKTEGLTTVSGTDRP